MQSLDESKKSATYYRQLVDIEDRLNILDRRQAIRDLYSVLDLSEYDPSPIEWPKIMTKAEVVLWNEIRAQGLRFWPQYPAGHLFITFADPEKKVAIECDGLGYHGKRQLEYEQWKDGKLSAMGWRVFRVPGRDCTQGKAREAVSQIAEAIKEGR